MNKNRKKSFFALLITCLMIFSTVMTAFADDSSASFTEGKTMSFKPGSEYTDSDLFDDFKGVMPGDVLTETIFVKNENKEYDAVKLYLRAVTHDENGNPLSAAVSQSGETVATMNDFLSQLSMKIWNGETLIFEGAPNEVGGLKENVLLGKFRTGESTLLTVELSVPVELGNEYANRVGEVDWVFTIEEAPDPVYDDDDDPDPRPRRDPAPTPEPDIPVDVLTIEDNETPLGSVLGAFDDFGLLPATGDTTAILPYVLLLIAGIGGFSFLLITGRRKNQK